MRVLMQIRDNYLSNPGGDTVQLQKTKEYLEKMGVLVDVSTELSPDLSDYDLVHLFNLTRIQETFFQAKNCLKQGKRYVLSTIYWPFNEINRNAYKGLVGFIYKHFSDDFIESLKALFKFVFKKQRNKGCRYLVFHKCSKMQKYVISNAAVCLPNSMGEMDKIRDYLRVSNEKTVVVPNAIDREFALAALSDASEKYDAFKGFIVCAARISQRKNQILLLDALKNTDFKIVFVGKPSTGEQSYFKEFLKRVGENENAVYIDGMPNQELYRLFQVCKVSVLPSWFETPGLVSLEAASMGCNIVVTDKGTTTDYFKNYAFYCRSLEASELTDQIVKAYNSDFDVSFRQLIFDQYTWENAAQKTLQGYKMALL